MILVPVTENHFQSSRDDSQTQSCTVFYVPQEDEEAYSRQQNCYVGADDITGGNWGIPDEVKSLIYEGKASIKWSRTISTRDWVGTEGIHVVDTNNNELIYSAYVEAVA